MVGQRTRAALEREKILTLRAIKELEFDRAMGKCRTMISRRCPAVSGCAPPGSSGSSTPAAAIARDRAGSREADGRSTGPGRSGRPGGSELRQLCDRERRRRPVLQVVRSEAVRFDRGRVQSRPRRPRPDRRRSGHERTVPDARSEADVGHSPTGHDLPDRTISVRVIRGDLSNNLPDQPVEFIIDGKSQTVKTDDGGRAQVGPVPPGATVKAATTVDGERIESQEFPAPCRAVSG